MGITGRIQLHRLESAPTKGTLSIVCTGHLIQFLNGGSSFSWVPPERSGSMMDCASTFNAGTAALAVAGSTRGRGYHETKSQKFRHKNIGRYPRFTTNWAACVDSYSRIISKRGQNPGRRDFIFAHLKLHIFWAVDFAITTHLFKLGRINQ